MRRMPRLNIEVRLRSKLRGRFSSAFFARGGVVDRISHTDRDGLVQRQRYDLDKTTQAIGALNMAVLNAEPAGPSRGRHMDKLPTISRPNIAPPLTVG